MRLVRRKGVVGIVRGMNERYCRGGGWFGGVQCDGFWKVGTRALLMAQMFGQKYSAFAFSFESFL
jgi:hypothetical protein